MSIVCVGQLVADIVVRPVNGLPYPGRTEPVEELELLSGGCAANTAAVLAKLGAEAHLVALIGQDAFGDAALADLKAAGVNVDAVSRDRRCADVGGHRPGRRRRPAVVLLSPGHLETMSNRHVPESVLASARIVHVGGAMKLLNLDLAELMGRAKSFGCLTSLDTDWDVNGNWMRSSKTPCRGSTTSSPTKKKRPSSPGRETRAGRARPCSGTGRKLVAIKRGERGAMLATKDGIAEFPAYRVDVLDTTCAGDAFVAGFLLGVSRGRPLEESVRLGNAAGALCTTQISHRGVTSLEAVRRLIKEQGE